MSCCGQAKEQTGVVTNSQPFLGAGPGTIDSQPAYQPVLNYNNNGFLQPNVPTPPVAHHSTFSNGFQPPSPMREFGAASPPLAGSTFTGTTYNGQPQQTAFTGSTYNGQPQQPAMSTFTGSTYNNGSNFNSINQTITRPKSSHSPHSPPPQVNNAPVQDEGKMSISIDFGVCPHVTSSHSLILVQAQHSLVL
jgi:hypothetical protein